MTSYFLQLIGDMKDVLTRLDSEHERIHIEIYNIQDLNIGFISISMKLLLLQYNVCF